MEQITDLLYNANGASGTNLNQHSSHSQRTVSHSPIRPASAVHQISTSSLTGAQTQQNLQIREDPKIGIFVEGLTQIHVNSKEQLLKYVEMGIRKRN